jgi:hypothetical protein
MPSSSDFLQLGIDLFERLRRHFLVQRGEDGFALGRRQIGEDFGQFGGVHFAQALVLDLELDAPRRVDLDHVDKLPRNAVRGKAAGERFEGVAREAGL